MPLLPFPSNRQATSFDCGAAALQAVLYYFGLEVSEEDLVKALHTDEEDGTSPGYLAGYLVNRNFSVQAASGMTLQDLEKWIDLKSPVILLIQAWADKPNLDYTHALNNGHYVVAIGYDDQNIYFEDPALMGHLGSIPRDELDDRWHDTDNGHLFEHFGIAVYGREPKYNPKEILRVQASRVADAWLTRHSK